ncbi:MAG: hypothetical protein KME30_06475 [Iphinoe sp. HA4291-MV1]|nr:hypothetical protein [Iphinoe sp. HA4291-MV1]
MSESLPHATRWAKPRQGRWRKERPLSPSPIREAASCGHAQGTRWCGAPALGAMLPRGAAQRAIARLLIWLGNAIALGTKPNRHLAPFSIKPKKSSFLRKVQPVTLDLWSRNRVFGIGARYEPTYS